jgi:hypothetical protein
MRISTQHRSSFLCKKKIFLYTLLLGYIAAFFDPLTSKTRDKWYQGSEIILTK